MGDITKVNAVATTVFPKRPKSAGSTEMVDVENEDIMTFMLSTLTALSARLLALVLLPAVRTT